MLKKKKKKRRQNIRWEKGKTELYAHQTIQGHLLSKFGVEKKKKSF